MEEGERGHAPVSRPGGEVKEAEQPREGRGRRGVCCQGKAVRAPRGLGRGALRLGALDGLP